ncbi:hypothetical protein [Dethiobacter alkaliphilus]|uniref:Uncharacterized protein n=1 Tax=Dethiobacter alkaliphilus AHT 1 TaxID=555088 RepID=C0GD20_DETAL|nr:hypothetical protein [Dethiobacter alkaliphilus]EEG79105.1 hypothetical protein DealDRAFT_0379 [Dethiobacter alkaliphilus AHT 1]
MKIFGQKELPKKYQTSFLKGLKSGAAQVCSDTPCIIVDEAMPEKIVKAADIDLSKKKSKATCAPSVKIKYGRIKKANPKRKIV